MKLRKKMTAILLTAIFMISTFAVFIPVSADFEPYYYSATVGNQPVSIVVEDTGTQITWTIDFPLETPYDEPTQGRGSMVVGLVIALDGVGEGPAYQIHNTDNDQMTLTDGTLLVAGTWAMSPWDPTIPGNWEGWVSGFVNTLVTELDWVSCTGGRYNEVNPDGLFTISIDKSELGDSFHWALNLAIGSGFYSTYLVYEQMACPIATPGPSFNWATPLVDNVADNYEFAQIMSPMPTMPPKSDFVPGKGKGLDKPIPNENFAKGRGPNGPNVPNQNANENAHKNANKHRNGNGDM